MRIPRSLTDESIEDTILLIRGQRVILDHDSSEALWCGHQSPQPGRQAKS